jgi:hypothetical protein
MSEFKPGLEGVVAFETEIAEPDRDGGALRNGAPQPHGSTRVRDDVALTFDDVLLVPAHSLTHPKDVSTATRFSRG